MNRVRAGVLALLAAAACVYASRLPLALTGVNFAVLVPALAWTVTQEIAIHRRGRAPHGLGTLNAAVDISAVTILLLGYGIVGTPELSVASPVWLAYFVVLAARPFAGSPRQALAAAAIAVGEYLALVAFLVAFRGLELHADPLAAATTGGTSFFGEGAKIALLAVAGFVTAYATGWYERTLARAAEAVRAAEAELRGLAAELAHRSVHDPLTNLANRTLFRDRAAHALERARRSGEQVAVLLVDLDAFKKVNDALGYSEGDELLRTVSQRLLAATRGSDTVARLGGDEFAVLIESVREYDEIGIVADRIVASLGRQVPLSGKPVTVGVTIGIATDQDADDVESLLRNADVALLMAKSQRRGGYIYYAAESHAAVIDRLALETDMPAAIERRQFSLEYQPIVDLETGRLAGVEALLRWAHPHRGVVPPGEFIPIAEDTGLIVPLGRWVIDEVCRQGARWHQTTGRGVLTISVNISARQLADEDLVGDVKAALQASRIDPQSLVLEITESVLVRDADSTLDRLRQLKGLGVRLAIDDFGTGYSSLSQLRRFPMDILKIDKAFIDGLTGSPKGAALARAIFSLGDSLGLRCIAEGVEHAAQHAALRALGCAQAQGFLFAKPLPPGQVDALLEPRVHAPERRTPGPVAT